MVFLVNVTLTVVPSLLIDDDDGAFNGYADGSLDGCSDDVVDGHADDVNVKRFI